MPVDRSQSGRAPLPVKPNSRTISEKESAVFTTNIFRQLKLHGLPRRNKRSSPIWGRKITTEGVTNPKCDNPWSYAFAGVAFTKIVAARQRKFHAMRRVTLFL